jgi:phage repressor protein C with HTH and peptisase S24 domain
MLLGCGLNFGPALDRYFPAVVPALDRSVIGVIELSGHLSDAAEPRDDFPMGFHAPYVRSQRTTVNAENVPASSDKYGMASDTVGEKLVALRTRSGLSLEQVAKAMGLAGRSSVQRLFSGDVDALGPVDALRLADVFEGKGSPPITREEVTRLSRFALAEVRPNDMPAPRYMQLPRDVPVYGTAMGTYKTGGEDQEVEQTDLNQSDIIDQFTRPPGYANRTGLYGLYVAGPSMEPRWESGDPLYVDPKRPPAIGDDVVVYLARPSGEDRELEAVLIKRLARRSGSFIELEQFNPPLTFRVETRRIKAIHRVIPRKELLAFS